MRVNTKCEGGTSRVTGKIKKVQLVLKQKVKCTRGELKCEGRKIKDYEGDIKGTIVKKNKSLRVEIKGAVSTKGEIKCTTWENKHVKRENQGLRGKIKGTKAKEENERLRVKIKGAGSANGENKMHEGEIKCERWK